MLQERGSKGTDIIADVQTFSFVLDLKPQGCQFSVHPFSCQGQLSHSDLQRSTLVLMSAREGIGQHIHWSSVVAISLHLNFFKSNLFLRERLCASG